MTPSALTREQVEEMLHVGVMLELHGNAEIYARALLDNDAALRLILIQQAQEIEEQKGKLIGLCQAHGNVLIETHDLKQEIKRLKDIIKREAWLEEATSKDLPSPYVPWDQFSDLKQQLAAQSQEIERLKDRNRNLMDVLRAIASMKITEADRMQQWAKDGLSGFVEPIESTVLKLTDALAAMTTERDACKEISDWFGSLVKRASIGTKETPSLRAYIEQIEAKLSAKDLSLEGSRAEVAALEQQLATAQARVKELDELIVTMLNKIPGDERIDALAKAIAANTKDRTQLIELQATLAAREARIVELERAVEVHQAAHQTCNEHRARIFDERDAVVQEAARLKKAILWALGYCSFRARQEGEGAYWWRRELRQRAFPDGVTTAEIATLDYSYEA